ncbi:hypothetical protein WHI96_00020 [Pseudonocardia tropica]|uniref:Uncharacterized protein n=1 Tax=Pseudonocardia tropica TaxID=681289 RepID=A0ABV1JNS8_9PSEU
MAPSKPRRTRGNVTWLPSGSARVSVFGGVDQVTGEASPARETVPARATCRETERDRVQRPALSKDDGDSPISVLGPAGRSCEVAVVGVGDLREAGEMGIGRRGS